MPIYELRCAQCTRSFELEESVSSYDRKKRQGIHCPSCNAIDVRPQISMVEVKTSKKS